MYFDVNPGRRGRSGRDDFVGIFGQVGYDDNDESDWVYLGLRESRLDTGFIKDAGLTELKK